MVEIIEHSDEELRLNELTDSDDPRHLDGKFVFFLDSVGDEELADRFFEGNTEGNDMSRLERRRVEFQGIYNKSRIVEKAIRQDVVLVSELLGEKSGDKGLIDRAIEASPGGLGEIAKTSGGKKFIEDTIVLNLEIIAIENPSVFKQLERAIDEINKAVSKFREREKELFNLCDECSISGDVLIESFKKDPKTRNREIGQAIWDASKRLDEGQRKKLDSLDKKEDLERLRDEIDKALNVLARAIASAKNTEAVKDNVKKSVAESEKEDTSAEEEEDEESEEELESDTVEYAEDKVEKKEWFRNKFAIESTSSGNVWVASIFDKDENGRMKTVKCIVEEESIKSMQKDGQYMLPGVEYYFEPSHEKSKKKGEKGKKKESKSTDGRYDLLRYVKIRKPYPKEANQLDDLTRLSTIGEVRLYAEQEGLKVKITVADGAKGIDFVKEKVRKEMKKEEGKREWDELEGVDMTVLERYIEDEKLNVSTAGKDEATVVSEIREEEKRQREAFVKKLNDPEFVKSFLHRYIDDKFRGNAVRIKAVKAQVDALNNNQRKEYAKKIV